MTEVDGEDADLSTNAEIEIKEEIIIKDEIEIDEESIIKLINTNDLKHTLKRVPVVYTTRLDDMLIFKKKIQNLSVDDIVENVILESKPKLSQSFNQRANCIPQFDGQTFIELSETINQFNKLTEISKSDKENVSFSPPEKDTEFNKLTTLKTSTAGAKNVSLITSEISESDEENVPLRLFSENRVDSNADNLKATKPDPKIKLARRCKTCSVRLALSSRVVLFNGKKHLIYDKAIENENEMSFCDGILYKVGTNCMIVFRDLRRKSMDLHIFGKDGLFTKTINKLNCSSIKTISKLRYLKYTLYVDICCWFRRQHVLNCFIWCDNINSNIFRKAHTCQCSQCDCCCKGKYIIDDGVKKLQKRTYDESSKPGRNNFVNDALGFSRNNILASDSITKRKVLADTDDCLGIQILKGYSDMTEFYELKSDGNIVKHIEMRSKNLHISNNFRNTTKLNADSDRIYCCWRKRDEMLKSFEYKDMFMITQFIRTPHPCPPGDCICCCKPSSGLTQSSTLSDKVNHLKSSKYSPEHVHNYASIIKRRRQFLAKPKNINKIQKKIVPPIQDNKSVQSESSCPKLTDFETLIPLDIKGKTVNSTITSDGTQKSVTKKRSVSSGVAPSKVKAKSKVRKTIPSEINAKPIPIQTTAATHTTTPVMPTLIPRLPKLANITPAQSNIALPENNMASLPNPLTNVPIVNNPQAQDSTVNSLVNSLLHRFNDVRLIITPDGNVSAEINKPMQNLTTPELQILSKILTHAKEQVQALKAAGHLNSGAKTVLNPWPSNLNSNTDFTPAPVAVNMPVNSSASLQPPSAPSIIANTDNSLNVRTEQPPGPTSSTSSTFSFGNTTNKENDNKKSRLDAFQCYTNLSALKMKEYLTSCKSYLSDVKFAPKIKDVFSLKNTSGKNAPDTITSQGSIASKITTTITDPNLNTSGVKRKPQQKHKNNAKKRKTAITNRNNCKTTKGVNIDTIDPVTDENDLSNSSPQPAVSPVPIISSMVNNNVMGLPMVSGLFNTPNVFPSGSMFAPNQLHVAVPFAPASGVPTIEVPYAIPGPSTSSDIVPKMEEPYVIPGQSISPVSIPTIEVPFVIPGPSISPDSDPEMEEPYIAGQSNDTEETNDEDCILGF